MKATTGEVRQVKQEEQIVEIDVSLEWATWVKAPCLLIEHLLSACKR